MYGDSGDGSSGIPDASIADHNRMLEFLPRFIQQNKRQEILVADDPASSDLIHPASDSDA